MRTIRVLLLALITALIVVVGLRPAPASAAVRLDGATCSGTQESPGVLAGAYPDGVTVNGVCDVNGGAATVDGTLTVSPGSALVAAFALDDHGTGTSSLDVSGDVEVDSGATIVMGCEPNYFPCLDDPAASTGGTLSGKDTVSGNLVGNDPLGIVVHASDVSGNITEIGGGGGENCTPQGIFSSMQSPVYSDYEDVTLGGSLIIAGLKTCWLGALRDKVGISLVDAANAMADPDADEIAQNTVQDDLSCTDNDPVVQFGDSGASPNVVIGQGVGECAYDVLSADADFGDGGDIPIAIRTHLSYWLAGSNGAVYAFGSAASFGGAQGEGLKAPIVGMAASTDAHGYWLAGSDGGVFAYGDAEFYGSEGGVHLKEPVVGIAATPDAKGYWLVAADGGVFAFGDAKFYGSLDSVGVSVHDIVGIAPTPDGGGYWLVGSDGGVFSFGNAKFLGSMGGTRLSKPVVGMAATPGGKGYWLFGADGGVFAFGAAHFYGSAATGTLTSPVVAGLAPPGFAGNWLITASGHALGYGPGATAPTGSAPPGATIVGAAVSLS